MTNILMIEGEIDNFKFITKNTEINLQEFVKENVNISYDTIIKKLSETLEEASEYSYNWLPKADGGLLEEILLSTSSKINHPQIDSETIYEALLDFIPYDQKSGTEVHTITKIKTIPRDIFKIYY